MKHRDKIVIQKIISEIDTGLRIFNGISFEEFENNEIIKRAVCMTAINIGELIKLVSNDLRIKYNKIPWKKIAGFRDIAAHKYESLNIKDVYDTVNDDCSILKYSLIEILSIENMDL